MREDQTRWRIKVAKFDIYNQIIIRFSLRVNDWQLKVAGSLSEESREKWFEYRVAIFKLTVITSLISQVKRPDQVILLFDNSDRLLWKNFFLPLLKDISFSIVPIFKGWDFSKDLIELSNYVPAKFTHINSIRMDSDDLLAKSFISEINDALTSSDFLRYLVFPSGIRFDKSKWQRLDYCDNPFLTYCVQKGNFHNILSINHEKVRDYPHLILNNNKLMWAQYVHGSNVSNKFRDLQSYDGFKSYDLIDNALLNFSDFGLVPDIKDALFNLESFSN